MPNSSQSLDRSGAGTPPVIDVAVFRALASVLGNETAIRLTATFMQDAERRVELLDRQGVTPADLHEHAHALVSIAGHLGFLQMSALCLDLQNRARQDAGLEGCALLRQAFERLRAALDRAVATGVLCHPETRQPRHERLRRA